ncbi:unnamed protein product [Heterobilharzia americana]|nr:unnamed protein product [Heterobilharzia americana]
MAATLSPSDFESYGSATTFKFSMTQPPVSVRLTLPAKQNFLGSGLVQVLQGQPCSEAQSIMQQRSQNLNPLNAIRPLVSSVPGMAINTNTAVQYVRKPAEISVLGAAGTFVATPMNQTFTPFVNPIMNLNPSMISSIPGGPTGGSGQHLVKPPPESLPHVFFTWEVIEATTSCMLAQADEVERRDLPPAAQERIILEEFGRTLDRVIEAASKAQIRLSSGIHTSASIDDNDQGLVHSGGSTGPGSLGGKGVGAIGVATAAAAAAEVLQDDDDEDDEMMHEMDVEEDEDPDEMEDEMYGIVGGTTISRHGHPRSPLTRRHISSSHRPTHLVPEFDDDILSDDDPVDRTHAVPSTVRQGTITHRYQDSHTRRTQHLSDDRYTSHHLRRSISNRSHRYHDPDSMV